MRKILIALAVLFLAAPAWATVNVDCTVLDLGSDPNYTIAVTYTVGGGDANVPRAFGITIDVNNGAVISGIDVNDKDYYIFPGSIDINDTTGDVDDYGSAVVDYNSNPNGGFTLEMGSLYAATDPCHTTAPPSSGTLCTFDVSKECVVSLSRDTDRGGVVMEDGSDYASLNGCTVVYDNCFPQGHSKWAEYDAVGRPDCWCYPRQCHGDADGVLHSDKSQTYDFWVCMPDLQRVGQGWYKPDEDPNYSSFICADFNRRVESDKSVAYDFRVGMPDLQILAAYWMGPNGGKPAPDANCLTIY